MQIGTPEKAPESVSVRIQSSSTHRAELGDDWKHARMLRGKAIGEGVGTAQFRRLFEVDKEHRRGCRYSSMRDGEEAGAGQSKSHSHYGVEERSRNLGIEQASRQDKGVRPDKISGQNIDILSIRETIPSVPLNRQRVSIKR